MKNTYLDLIKQSYSFPQEGFALENGSLSFHGISLSALIEKHGTPFKVMYLPKIGQQISKAKSIFNQAIEKHNYKGQYHYSYCTKCCHYSHVVKKAVQAGAQLETSSALDIDIITDLFKKGEISKSTIIIHNGYKTENYLEKIIRLTRDGFKNSIMVLDSKSELKRVKKYAGGLETPIKLGIRMAIDEEPQSAYYTSRLGIRAAEIIDFYHEEIEGEKSFRLTMFHFYIDSGIKDTIYYWGEFKKALKHYVELKQVCPDLAAFNLGGGFPIRNNLAFEYDHEYIINEIVGNIKQACIDAEIEEPDIFTEFGKFTVGESGAIIFKVLEQKQQNDAELWYMVDNSLMNTIPDAWSIFEKFIMLPVNKWTNDYTRVNIGGISCDQSDYYNSEDMNQQLLLPKFASHDAEPLYVGFFHTGAYQDAISGYGGIKHCLIPTPKLILIDKDEDGIFIETVYKNEHSVEEMLKILGYNG